MIETKTDDAYQLGTWVGRKQAFATLAGRCSAADAECLRQARESRGYRKLGMNWGQFCQRRLGMSRASADRIIGLLQEFGPQYFALTHATGVTPGEYRRISSAVKGQNLLHAGEEIPIQAENAPRLAAAVEELRRGERASAEINAAADPAVDQANAAIEREFTKAKAAVKTALAQFQRLVDRRLEGPPRSRLVSELGYAVAKLRDLEQASWKQPTGDRAA